MRTPVVIVGIVGLGLVACQPQPRAGSESTPAPKLGASSVTAPPRTPPSLEEVQRAQGAIAAKALSQKTGIPMEAVTGAAPAWWPQGVAAGGLGRGQGPTLEAAYQGAVRQARGSSTGGMGVLKAAWARLTTGEFVAWVQAGKANVPAASPPPVVASEPAVAMPTPAVREEPAPITAAPGAGAASAAPAGVPAWFSTVAKEVNGRVQVAASADAPTVKEAPRMAIEAARAALSQAMGKDVTDMQAESTFVTMVDGRYRAYVLVSSPGTIKK